VASFDRVSNNCQALSVGVIPAPITGADGGLIAVTSAAADCAARVVAMLVTATAANCDAAPTSHDAALAVAFDVTDAMSANLVAGDEPFVAVGDQLTLAAFVLQSTRGLSGAVAATGFAFEMTLAPAAVLALAAGSKLAASAMVFADGGAHPLQAAALLETR